MIPRKRHGHKPVENHNKKIALLIAVIALFRLLGDARQKAQTAGIELGIKASDTWASSRPKQPPGHAVYGRRRMAAELTAGPMIHPRRR
jgi:hypothetical protein